MCGPPLESGEPDSEQGEEAEYSQCKSIRLSGPLFPNTPSELNSSQGIPSLLRAPLVPKAKG